MKTTIARIFACATLVLLAAAATSTAADAPNRLVLHPEQARTKIDRNIYGHFAEHLGHCIYEGIWVGEGSPIPNTRGIRNDVVAALKAIKIPVLRWPGGCFADEYHWMDGIGPREQRPTMINNHWGGVTENNHFGTHEFFDLCEQLECEPYICGNLGSGTVHEMQQWVEYMTSANVSPMTDLRKKNGRAEPWKLKYFGVGNENWGCGGNMTPEYYANEYKRYATYVRGYSGNSIVKVACGASGGNYAWTEVLMREAGKRMHALALHYYCGSGKKKQLATQFDEADWFVLLQKALKMDELVSGHAAIMDKYDPEKKVAMYVDEWGTWHLVEPGTNPGFLYQQNTMRDALAAAVTFDVFNRHADRVKMANIAQTVNVLQAMVLTDGPKMLLTPTYHVFEMYSVHQDATLVPAELTCADYELDGQKIPGISASCSKAKDGKLNLTLSNVNPATSAALAVELGGAGGRVTAARVLTADTMQAHNTFEKADAVKPAPFTAFKADGGVVTVELPAKSLVVLEIALD